MQISDLCKSCSKQNFCGNGITNHYCTGYAPITYQYHTDIKTPPFDADVELDKLDKLNDIKTPPFTDGQKEVIEAIEKLANGKLICDVDDDITDIKELLNDTIKRIEEPTNEEWIKQCTTEQLAEWLQEHMDCASCGCNKDLCYKGYDCCKLAVLEWLKQPHSFE